MDHYVICNGCNQYTVNKVELKVYGTFFKNVTGELKVPDLKLIIPMAQVD